MYSIKSNEKTITYLNRNVRFDDQKMTDRKTLGISMIVKDEAKIIKKCLESVAPYIDYWTIHDTGSSDSTIDIILDFFRNYKNPDGELISGELHRVEWKNFGWNRNKALEIAKTRTDYCLLMDADFILKVHDPDFRSKLHTPGYLIKYEGGLEYRQILLIESQHNWEYRGVTHEFIDVYPERKPSEITNMITIDHTLQGSSRPDKFERDAALLEQGIIDEPNNARYYFYLGQSYKDMGSYKKAIKAYKKRIEMTDFDEEVFYSHYQIGMCKKKRGNDFHEYVGDLLQAYLIKKNRIEPIYQIIDSCLYGSKKVIKTDTNDNKDNDENIELYKFGYYVGKLVENYTFPNYDLLFIEKPLYDWMFLDLWATCTHKAGLFDEAAEITSRILKEKKYHSEEDKNRFMNNLKILQRQSLNNIPKGKARPYEFLRIEPDKKIDRVAVIIHNYNMIEKTTRIINFLRNMDQTYPMDLIVVDDGSDMFPPSNFTTVLRTINMGESISYNDGLKFTRTLERNENFRYLGYLFISNHSEIPLQIDGKSLIGKLCNILKEREKCVAVHPSLTVDSLVDFPNLIYPFMKDEDLISRDLEDNFRLTNMVSNHFVLYRKDWFDKNIGEFNIEFVENIGMNIEISYLARKMGYELCLECTSLVRIIENLNIKIDRCKSLGEMSKEKFVEINKKEAISKFVEYAIKKYGNMNVFNENLIDDEIIPKWYNHTMVNKYINTLLQFENVEGGHKLLMDYLYHHHQVTYLLKKQANPIIVVEIGGTNNIYPHLDSSGKLELLCRVYGYQFISIDKSEAITRQNLGRSLDVNSKNKNFYMNGFRSQYIHDKGARYLSNEVTKMRSNRHDPIHFAYIDTVDVYNISDANKEKTLMECTQTNLQILKLLTKLIPLGGAVAIAYTTPEVNDYLLQQGYKLETHNQKTKSSLYRNTKNPSNN
tara:strand:+ start:225 stop:3035 length:2811 start_codon:yes stop_codon:yes gene_type:complete